MRFIGKVDTSEVDKLVNRLISNAENLTPVMNMIGEDLRDSSETAFEREGPGWKDLKPGTKRQRRKKGKWPGKKLQVSGRLAASVEHQNVGLSILLGSNLPYAAAHQEGMDIRHPGTNNGFGRGIVIPPHTIPIPSRAYLILGKKEVNMAIKRLTTHLLK